MRTASTPTISSQAVAFTDMSSRCPNPALDAAHRVDPYWTGLWTVGSTASWLSRPTAERQVQAGLGQLRVSESRWSVEEAMDRIVGRQRTTRLSALAALGLWRTMSDEQLACIVGKPALASRRSTDRALLWAAGLIQKGTFVTGLKHGHAPMLLRPDPEGRIDMLSDRMTYTEWVGVTGGQPWRWGSQFDRHNILGTELALRVAEWCEIGTVFGEALAGLNILAPEEVRVPESVTRAADAVLVRPDGMRIAVELTTSVTPNMQTKIKKWVDVLTANTSGGLAVVFVDATHPDRSRQAVTVALQKAITEAAHCSMDATLADVPERMSIARWREWFPEPGLVARSFEWLAAHRPTGPDGATWEPVNLLDPFDLEFEPDDPVAAQAVLTNANLLYGVPHWLRDPKAAPDLTSVLRARAGLTIRPTLPPSRSRSSF